MGNGDDKVSSLHIMLAIACYLQGSSLITTFLTSVTKQDSWFVILAGYLVSLALSGIYIALAGKYPGKSIVEINDAVFGKAAAKLVSSLYAFFFLSLSALNAMDVGNFVGDELLEGTPNGLITAVFLFFCAWAIRKGISHLLQSAMIFFFVASALILLSILLQLPDYDVRNFLPMFTLPPAKYLQGLHIITAVPLLEIVAFFMIFPLMKNQKDVKKVMFGGLGLGTVTLVLIVFRNYSILGNMVGSYRNPSYISLHLIDIADVLTRMEVIFSIIFITLLFFKVTLLYYASQLAIAQIFGLKKQENLTYVIGAFILMYSHIVFQSGAENAEWGSSSAPLFSIFFELVLPLLTLLVAAFRVPSSGREVGRPE